MKPFFSRNIDNKGRLVRGLGALVLLVGAGFGFRFRVPRYSPFSLTRTIFRRSLRLG